MLNGVFSDFELDQLGIKLNGANAYVSANCVGSCEEEMETKTVTKSCRGVVVKKIARGTGNGTLKLSLHIPYAVYTEAYGMDLDTLIAGVKAYGKNSVHKTLSIVMHIKDEDGAEKLKAYPNCILEAGMSRKIENGAEEVAELELEISVMPDEYGNGLYEAIVDDVTDTNAKTTWMTNFTPDLVQVPSA